MPCLSLAKQKPRNGVVEQANNNNNNNNKNNNNKKEGNKYKNGHKSCLDLREPTISIEILMGFHKVCNFHK